MFSRRVDDARRYMGVVALFLAVAPDPLKNTYLSYVVSKPPWFS